MWNAAAFYSSGACTQQSWRSVKKIRTVGLSEFEINQTFSIADVNKKGSLERLPRNPCKSAANKNLVVLGKAYSDLVRIEVYKRVESVFLTLSW